MKLDPVWIQFCAEFGAPCWLTSELSWFSTAGPRMSARPVKEEVVVTCCSQHGRLWVGLYFQGRKQLRRVLVVFLCWGWGRGGGLGVMMLCSFPLWSGHGWAHRSPPPPPAAG